MDKMLELLEGLGGSAELAGAFQEHLKQYMADLKARYDRDLQEAIVKVKQVCIEETNKEKAELAKKLQIFVESKAQSMEQTAVKQRTMEDTEAISVLKRAKGLLEGIHVDDDGINQKLQAMEKKASRLEAKSEALREERNQAVSKANEMAKAAKHFAEENRRLAETQVVTEKKCDDCKCDPCECEAVPKKGPKAKVAVPESRQRKSLPASRRLDEGRKPRSRVGSTRRPITESKAPSRSQSAPRRSGVDPIEAIASDMPE